MIENYKLESKGKLTSLLNHIGINDFEGLMGFIRHLPYGRNSDRTKPELVLSEMKGTCSSKHALVKMVAIENDLAEIKLIIGIYKMDQLNTPKIGNALESAGLEYIPEAHCYLKINDERVDLTSVHSSFANVEIDLIEEIEILPEQTGTYKIEFHKSFLQTWIKGENIQLNIEDVWDLREQCINRLSTQNN